MVAQVPQCLHTDEAGEVSYLLVPDDHCSKSHFRD